MPHLLRAHRYPVSGSDALRWIKVAETVDWVQALAPERIEAHLPSVLEELVTLAQQAVDEHGPPTRLVGVYVADTLERVRVAGADARSQLGSMVLDNTVALIDHSLRHVRSLGRTTRGPFGATPGASRTARPEAVVIR